MNAPNRDSLARAAFDSYAGLKSNIPVGDLDVAKIACLRYIAAEINAVPPANFGLLVKTDQGGKIPSDIVVWSDTMEHFDLLSDRETSPGIWEIVYAGWNSKGFITNGAWQWMPVAPYSPAPTQEPTQAPQPVQQPAPPAGPSADEQALINSIANALGQLGSILQDVLTHQASIESKVDAIAVQIGSTHSDVSDALAIARSIQSHTVATANEVHGVKDTVQNVGNTVGTVAAQLGPLFNLIAALKGSPIHI